MDLAARSWLYRIHLIACIRFPVYRSGGLSWRERVAPADCRPPHISWIGRQALPLRCGLFDSRAADGHARVQGRRRDWHERLPSFARHLSPIFKPWPFWTPSTHRYSFVRFFVGVFVQPGEACSGGCVGCKPSINTGLAHSSSDCSAARPLQQFVVVQ